MTTIDPMALMAGLHLEDGRTWGEAAHDFQREDASAVLDSSPDAPRRHYLLRGRGMSKTTDVAGLVLSLMLAEAPTRAKAHVYAVDSEQAALFMDALAGIVGRTPGVAGAVEMGARFMRVRATGATVAVEASDGASAYGTRPWLTVADELAMWPATANHRRLWGAVVSAVPKVPGSRLLVIGTAGSPTGLGAEVWEESSASEHWHTSKNPGPSPWWSAADVAATRSDLTPAEWRRLILCEWAESDDALTSSEDVAAALRTSTVPADLSPRPGVDYVAALDVGTRRDLTALAVGHAETTAAGRRVVIDRVMYWRPADTGGRVDLAEVEAATLRLCRTYGARLRFDRMQAEQMTGNLTRAGVTTREYVFSASGANRLARTVFIALRDRALSLPDEDEVRSEFLSTRLVETGPGTIKLANPKGTHDDIVTAVGMVAVDLLSTPENTGGMVTVPGNTRAAAVVSSGPRPSLSRRVAARPAMPTALQVKRAAATPGQRAGRALLIPGSANDPRRTSIYARDRRGQR